MVSVKPAIASFAPASGAVGTKVVLTLTLSRTTSRELASGGLRFGHALATKWGVSSSMHVWAIVPKGATSGRITLVVPANRQPENGPLIPNERILSAQAFTVT